MIPLPQGRIWTAAAIIAVLVNIAFLAFALPSYWANKQAQLSLAATVDAQKSVISRLDAQMKDRDAATQAVLDKLQELAKATKTPAQAIKVLPQVVELPKPIYLQPAVDAAGKQLPDAPSAVIPPESIVPLFQTLAQCKEDAATLANCQADAKDTGAKLQAVITERDKAVTAAKGGTFWHRMKSAARWTAIGVAGGAVLGIVATHR
jgi:hypothetical protein